jgi:hypothetical protein
VEDKGYRAFLKALADRRTIAIAKVDVENAVKWQRSRDEMASPADFAETT